MSTVGSKCLENIVASSKELSILGHGKCLGGANDLHHWRKDLVVSWAADCYCMHLAGPSEPALHALLQKCMHE